jgi:hypothetical protein
VSQVRDSVVRILREDKLLDEDRVQEILKQEQESGQTLDRILLQKRSGSPSSRASRTRPCPRSS